MTIVTTPKAPTHECPGKCGMQVARNHFACTACWHRLPFRLRKPISTHFRRNPGAHQAAMRDAIDWYRESPAPSTQDVTT